MVLCHIRTRWGCAHERTVMFELLATYTVATLFMAGAWAFDRYMMKGED